MSTRIDQVINDFFIGFSMEDETSDISIHRLLKNVREAYGMKQVDVWRYWPGKLRFICSHSSEVEYTAPHQNAYIVVSGMDFAELMSMYDQDHVGDGKIPSFDHMYEGEVLHYGMFGKEAFYGMVCFHGERGHDWSEEEFEAIKKCGRALFHATLLSCPKDSVDKSAFLPGLGQDFRTSMNAIMGMTSIASNHLDDRKRVEESLKKITDSSNMIMNMIKDFYGSAFENLDMDRMSQDSKKESDYESESNFLEKAYFSNDFSKKRIMLVEDNELNREIACEFLQETGISIEEAETGKEALDLFTNTPEGYFDLIFMDISMPVMDGYQATIAIRSLERADAKKIPIVALSANALSEDVEAAKNAGMNEHISKPVDIEKLQCSLKKWIK